jgi:hypothetical protein
MRRLGWVVVCAGLAGGVARAEESVPPVVKHVPVKTAVKGEPLVFLVDIEDAHDVWAPTLYHRSAGTKNYTSVSLQPKKGITYTATIQVAGDFEYWIEAYDEFGNGPSRKGSAEKPLKVKATVPAALVVEAKTEPLPPPPKSPEERSAPLMAEKAPAVESAPGSPMAKSVGEKPIEAPSSVVVVAPAPIAGPAPVVVSAPAAVVPAPALQPAALAPDDGAPRKSNAVWWLTGGAAVVAAGAAALVWYLLPADETTYRGGVTSASFDRPGAAP